MAKLWSALVLVVTLAAATAALLAQGGRWSWTLDLFSHFAPIYGLVGLVCLAHVGLLARGLRHLGVGAGFAAVLGAAALMAPEYLRPAGPTSAAPAGTIKVVQFNMQRSNGDLARIADWLATERPDIVTITEARHDLRDCLTRQFGWRTAGAHGDLIIFTPAAYTVMRRPDLPKGVDLTFVNASYAQVGGPVEIVTTRFQWPTNEVTRKQPGGLASVLEQLPRDRMILTGDFNATPWSHQIRALDRSLGLARRDRAVATWPAEVFGRAWPLPILAIDHVYAGPGWATVKVERGPWLGSDHYPLIVTLAPVRP